MATNRIRRNSFEQLQSTMDDQQGSRFACDCGQDFFDEDYFKQHQQNNCKHRQTKCSFCNQTFSSNDALKSHLMECGNKTEQCPNCYQYIRRSHFTYHYENECAPIDEVETPPRPPRNPTNQRIQLNPNKPFARTDVPSSDSTINPTRTNGRYQLQSSNTHNSYGIIQCEYCHQKCEKDELKTHKEHCLSKPNYLTKSPTISTKSNSISHFSCDICNQQIDIRNWSKHTIECREENNRKLEERARLMSREPVIDDLPCENCNRLIPAERLHDHQSNCGQSRVGTQYEIIDYDRTRQANQQSARRIANNEQPIYPNQNGSLYRENLTRSTNDIQQRKRSNDRLYDGQNNRYPNDNHRSQRNLRRGYNKEIIINNEEGQKLVKKKKPSLFKRLCCGSTPVHD